MVFFFLKVGLLDALALLAADVLVSVADTLALVWLRRVVAANVGGELADSVLVDAFNGDLGVLFDRDLDRVRDRVENRVGEAEADVAEGADILMVKPAGPYLDIIRSIREEVDLPIAAYQVSGEYLMIKSAAKDGWIDEQKIMIESLTGIKRAGADMILTYFAKQFAQLS